MEHKRGVVCFFLFIALQLTCYAQTPPRLNIPGAVLLSQPSKPAYRPQRISQPSFSRPPPPREPVRPVFEETEENNNNNNNNNNEGFSSASQFLDDEVNKLGLAVLQTAVRQSDEDGNGGETEPPRPLQFRPERPVPVLRQDVRGGGALRQDFAQRPAPRANPPRQQLFREEQQQQQRLPPLRQVPQQQSRPAPPPQQSFRQTSAVRPPPRAQPAADYSEDEQRRRKPTVQILRKYRVDNEDGSITWGFENEDGTFKEETLGADCIIRGKYGYVDPDGVKREYSYEAGSKCDEPEEEELPEQLPPQQGGKFAQPPPNRKQQFRP